VVARAVDEEVGRGQRDRGTRRGGGFAHAVLGGVDQGEELAGWGSEGVVGGGLGRSFLERVAETSNALLTFGGPATRSSDSLAQNDMGLGGRSIPPW
jgi:hypothetical protein